MTGENPRAEITLKPIVYRVPGMQQIQIRRDIPYRNTEAGPLTLDLYRPGDSGTHPPAPAVVLVIGYSDIGARKMFGCRFKEMESYNSWAQLLAASGMIAVTYETATDPASETRAVFAFLRENAAELGIDRDRIGIWSCSGSVPCALAVLIEEPHGSLRCAALCYGFLMDLDGATLVADAAAQFRFVNPAHGKTPADLPRATPLMIVRAGQDQFPGLKETIDRFAPRALEANLPVTLANLPDAPHAFDILDDCDASRAAIRQVVAFLSAHLLQRASTDTTPSTC